MVKDNLNSQPVILLLLIAVAALLRFYGLDDRGLWGDESWSWFQANGSLLHTWRAVSADVHPPLFHIILNFSVRVLGDSETALRVPSALLGTLVVWLTYQLGTLLWDRTTGFLAALMATFSGFLIWYSQEARMYALLSCTAMGFVLTTIHATRTPSGRRLALNGLAGALLLYTHVYGSFIFAGVNAFVFLALLSRREWPRVPIKHWLLAQGAAVVAFSPWVIKLLSKASEMSHNGFWIPSLSTAFVETHLVQMAGGTAALVALVLLSLLAVSSIKPINRAPSVRKSATGSLDRLTAAFAMDWRIGLTVAWCVSSLVFGILASLAIDQNVFYDRYMSGSFPALLLLAALGLRKLQDTIPLMLPAALVTVMSFIPQFLGSPSFHISHVREMISDLKPKLLRGDRVLVIKGWQYPLFEYYLRGVDAVHFISVGDTESESSATAIAREFSEQNRVWILGEDLSPTETRRLVEQVPATYELIDSREYHEPEDRAYLFQRKAARQ